MHRPTALAALLLAIACAAPAPTPTPTTAPTPTPSATPTAVLSWFVTNALEGWTPECRDVPFVDCYGVAALFANNLARNWNWVREQSGGVITVTPRPACPDFGDISGGMQDPSFCWQAAARVTDGQVCMVIARQLRQMNGFDFGQVGGDEMAGLAVPPGYTPRNPCV